MATPALFIRLGSVLVCRLRDSRANFDWLGQMGKRASGGGGSNNGAKSQKLEKPWCEKLLQEVGPRPWLNLKIGNNS